MRKAILLALFFVLAISFSVSAQIKESKREMTQGTHSAMVLRLPAVEEKFVRDEWEDYMDNFYDVKTKKVRKSKEYLSDNAEITAIGGNTPIDVYAFFDGDKEDVEMTVWIDLGPAFLNSTDHPDRYKEAEKMMMRFALELAKETTKIELEEQEETLEDLEDDMDDLKKDNDKYHKIIENAKKKIAEAEEDIVKNEKDQVEMKKKIEAQKKMVEQVKRKLNDL